MSFFTMLLVLYVVSQDKLKQTFEQYGQILDDKKEV